MSVTAAVVGGVLVCVILILALDRLFRPRGEKLRDVELYGDGTSDGDGDGGD